MASPNFKPFVCIILVLTLAIPILYLLPCQNAELKIQDGELVEYDFAPQVDSFIGRTDPIYLSNENEIRDLFIKEPQELSTSAYEPPQLEPVGIDELVIENNSVVLFNTDSTPRSTTTRAKIDVGIEEVGYHGRIKELGWFAAGEVGKKTGIYLSLKNYGTEQASNINVNWIMTDYFEYQTANTTKNVAGLAAGDNITVTFDWTPNYANLYNITFEVTVNGDENLSNNKLGWGYISAAKWTDNFEDCEISDWTGDTSKYKWHITDTVQADPNNESHSSPHALYHGQELESAAGDEYSIDEDYVVTTPELDLRRFNTSYKAFLLYLFYGTSTVDKDELTIEVKKSMDDEFTEIDYVPSLSGSTTNGTGKFEWKFWHSDSTLPGIPINIYLGEIVQFRLHWKSDLVFEEKTGFYIDDFVIYGIEDPPPEKDVSVEEVYSATIDDNIWNLGVAGEPVTIKARVMNRGSSEVGPFDAKVKIADISGREEQVIGGKTQAISILSPNDSTDLTWTFVPSVSGIYYVNVSTHLEGDEVSENDFDESLSFKVAKFYFDNEDPALVIESENQWRSEPEGSWYITSVRRDPSPLAHTPTKAWYFGDPNRNYNTDLNVTLYTPVIDLEGAVLGLTYQYFQIHTNFRWYGSTSDNDRLYFEYALDEADDWQLVQSNNSENSGDSVISGEYTDNWHTWHEDLGLNEFAGHHVQFRLRFVSDPVPDPDNIGFYIDDLMVWVLEEEYGRPRVYDLDAYPDPVLNDGVETVTLSVNATSTDNTNPLVTIQTVEIDLAPLGGSSSSLQALYDDGDPEHGDTVENDGRFSVITTVVNNTEPGIKKLTVTATTSNDKKDRAFLFLNVRANQPPKIIETDPLGFEFSMMENETGTFTVIAVDPDPDDSQLLYQWFLDGGLVLEGYDNDTFEFTTFYNGEHSEGTYILNLTVADDGYPPLSTNFEWLIHVENVPPDFMLEEDDIALSKTNIIENDTIYINITIHNIAFPEDENITVLITQQSNLAMAPEKTIAIVTIPVIPGRSGKNISVVWIADIDADWIKVAIDPEDRLLEVNEDNNEAAKPVAVSAKPPPPPPDDVPEEDLNRSHPDSFVVDVNILVTSTVITLVIIMGFISVGTEFGTYKMVSMFIPLYSRVSGRKILDHSLRQRIYNQIKMHPGIHYRFIMSELKLKNGTLVHHLMRLEQEELIKSERDGVYKRFYPMGMQIPRSEVGRFYPDGTRTYNIGEHQVSELQMNIIDIIRERPGLTQKEIASRINESRRVVNYHIKLLLAHKIIYLEKVGRETRCFIVDEVS